MSLFGIQSLLALLGIFHAERASAAHFWWLGELSNAKSPVANPLTLDSKMSITFSTWHIRSSQEKYPSQFFLALKTMCASLNSVNQSVIIIGLVRYALITIH